MLKTLSPIRRQHSLLSCQKLLSLCFVLFLPLLICAQNTFQVLNEENEALIGVEVYSPQQDFTGTTDLNGKIKVPNEIAELSFRYLGYELLLVKLYELDDPIIRLKKDQIELDQVTIVGRTGMIKEEIPYHVETINPKQIKLINTQTSADALAAHSNVYVQKSQMGGGSPVLRGFEANKILLVVDGVRLNNAIYRSGHLQNAITIDQAILKRMEVIFGAGSLNYGSDALGGVIHFRSKDPILNFEAGKEANAEQNLSLRHATANSEKSFHYDFMYGSSKWGSLSSVSYSKFGDLNSGSNGSDKYPDFGKRQDFVATINGMDSIVQNNRNRKQIGTAYRQLDLFQKFLFQFNEQTKLVLNGQYSTSSDVPRYDRLTERDLNDQLAFAEWYYGPQNRLLLSGKFEHHQSTRFFDKALVIGSYQKIDEDRIDRDYQSEERNHQEEDVQVIGLTIDFNKELGRRINHTLRYGVDIQHNLVNSEAFQQNINTGIRNFNVISRYPSDNSSLSSLGIYSQYTLKNKSENLISNSGLRFSASKIKIQYDPSDPFPWPTNFVTGLESSNHSLVASTGLNYHPTKQLSFHGLAATAYRAPNIDDMAKIRVKGNEVSVPNLDLNPEKSVNLEVGFTLKDKQKNYFQAALFYTYINDIIVRQPLPLPNGSNFIVDGMDTLITMGNINADKGYVYGFTMNASQKIIEKLKWNGSLNYTYGRSKNEFGETPLSHIPPLFGKIGLDWSYENFEISAIWRYNGKKSLSEYGDSTDNPEQATPEGSLAWSTYNLYMRYPYSDYLELTIGVENILDAHYRPFASGVSGAGRNLILGLRSSF